MGEALTYADTNTFEIQRKESGANFVFTCDSEELRDEWVNAYQQTLVIH